MNSADVIAYQTDGCRLCPDCAEAEPDVQDFDAVFANNADEINGETCENCRSFFVSARMEWEPYTEVNYYHWVRCTFCNHQEPQPADDARVRLAHMRGYRCLSCGKDTLHWNA